MAADPGATEKWIENLGRQQTGIQEPVLVKLGLRSPRQLVVKIGRSPGSSAVWWRKAPLTLVGEARRGVEEGDSSAVVRS